MSNYKHYGYVGSRSPLSKYPRNYEGSNLLIDIKLKVYFYSYRIPSLTFAMARITRIFLMFLSRSKLNFIAETFIFELNEYNDLIKTVSITNKSRIWFDVLSSFQIRYMTSQMKYKIIQSTLFH